MIELEKIALSNIVVHKDTSVELEDGISIFRGENGSGKSLLFSCIPNVFDGCPPLLKKKDAKVLHSEDSAIGIKYKYKGNIYRVVQKSKKGNISYEIEENGIQQEPRTISIAKDYLEKIFPLSASHYYSLVHLTSNRPHILLSGTGPQRKEFFEELFRLNISEFVSEQLKLEYNKLKRALDEKDILQNQLKELTYVDNLENLEEKYLKVEEKYLKLNEQYQKYSANIQKITSILTYKSQLKTGLSKQELIGKIKDIEEKLGKIKKLETKILVDIDLYNSNQKDLEEKVQIEKTLTQYSNILKTSEDLKEEYNCLNKIRVSMEQTIEDSKVNNQKYLEMKSLEVGVLEEYQKMTLEEYQKMVTEAEFSKKGKEATILKLEKLAGEATCPTCQQGLNEKEIKDLISSCEQEILYLCISLRNKDNIIKWFKLKELQLQEVDIKELESRLGEAKENLRSIKKNYEEALEKEKLERKLLAFSKILDLEKPDEEKLEEYKIKQNKGTEILAQCNADLIIQRELEKLKEGSSDAFNLKELEGFLEDLAPKLEKLNSLRMSLSNDISIGRSQNTLYKQKEERIKDIDIETKRVPVYEALIKAYSAKGIRISQIQYLADMFCANLNKYSNLVFNKKINFSIIVDNTNFNIIAERNGGLAADVCTLSGAESRCFVLLCALSLLPFIPEQLRCDTLILDEMEAGMSAATRKHITQGFYKTILSFVPKLIIVTPMSGGEFYVDSQHEYNIKLKDSTTSILEKIK